MNAGGKYGDLGAFVQTVTVMDDEGTIFQRTRDDLIFDYRHTNINARFILGATLALEEEDPERIMKRTKEIWMFKQNSQPLNTKNCGCVFKNPRGVSAGALIAWGSTLLPDAYHIGGMSMEGLKGSFTTFGFSVPQANP